MTHPNDDWRGESLIRSKPLTESQRRSRNQSTLQTIIHKKRTARGENMAACGGPWAKTMTGWAKTGVLHGAGGDHE